MRRRNLAALLVAVPLILAVALYGLFPETRELLMAYLLSVALVFKGALLSFYSASKLKLVAFFKSLTLLQGSLLLLKRWFLDNVLSRWIRRSVLEPMSSAWRELRGYVLGLGRRAKVRGALLLLGASGVSLWLLYSGGYLGHIFLFTELKIIVVSLSKTLLLLLSKAAGLIFDSWITPVLEVFAFSWLFVWLERTLGPRHPVNRFIAWLGRGIGRLFSLVGMRIRAIVDPWFHHAVRRRSRRFSHKIAKYIRSKKIAYEAESFHRLEQALLNAHLQAYLSDKGLERVRDKRRLYALINRRMPDGIEIVAFVSRDARGRLLPAEADDSYYDDLFLLEGIASSQSRGVHAELQGLPDASDFWVLNSSVYPVTIGSHSGVIPTLDIEPQSLRLIQCDRMPDYQAGDLYARYRGRSEAFVAVPTSR